VFPRPCAEFPNDNPALYDSVVSLSSEPWPTAIKESRDHERLEEEPCKDATPPPLEVDEPPDPFANLVSVLEIVARDAGASASQAATVRGLLGQERLATASLSEAALEALFAGMQLEGTPQVPRRTAAFTETVLAWQAILRGEGEDFASCGSATLDEWTADLVARLLGNPTLAAQVRRELRKRGVAAFGLVAEAA
jgi:hypothetical protein